MTNLDDFYRCVAVLGCFGELLDVRRALRDGMPEDYARRVAGWKYRIADHDGSSDPEAVGRSAVDLMVAGAVGRGEGPIFLAAALEVYDERVLASAGLASG